MNFLKRAGLFLFAALLLANCGGPSGGGCSGVPVPPPDQFLGSQAQNFILPNLEGDPVELAALVNQKPTLLVFWATWCPTCVEEIPILNEWYEKYPGLQILAVNVQEPAARVRAFSEKRKIQYPILLDEEAEVAQQYGLVGIPAAILLAQGGKVIYYGFALPRNVEQLIQD